MAATTGGALKVLIESSGLGLSAYRGVVPDDATLPYVVIFDGITTETVSMGDNGNEDVEKENVQMDLYEQYLSPTTGRVVEDSSLGRRLKRAVHGKQLTASPTHCYGLKVPFNSRTEIADENTTRTRFSVDLVRAF